MHDESLVRLKNTGASPLLTTVAADDTPHWYVIQTKPKEEDRADSNLRAWKIETFVPKLKEKKFGQYASYHGFVVKHLFPRYIFARFSANRLFHVNYTRGVQKVVSFGNGPTPVEDEIVDLIRSRISDDGFVRLGESFKSGDAIVVKAGPLKGLVGIFERSLNDDERVMILLSTVNFQGRITVERELIQKAARGKTIRNY